MVGLNILKQFGLLILLWNSRSLASNVIEFNLLLNKTKPGIVCITETWFRLTSSHNFKGYNLFRKDRFGSTGGGVAILVRQDIAVLPNNFTYYQDGYLEALVVTVDIDDKNCNICVAYNPTENITEMEFTHYFNGLGNNSIFCGDFNAHDPLWTNRIGRHNSNFSGTSLMSSYISSLGFNLLTTPGLKTCMSASTGLYSTIDLMFGSGLFNIADEVVAHSSIGSDHIPIFYCFEVNPSLILSKSPHSWKLGGIKWAKWRKDIETEYDHNKTYSIPEFSQMLIDVTLKNAPLKSSDIKPRFGKPFWSQQCSYMVALRRRARAQYIKSPSRATRSNFYKQAALTKRFLRKQKRQSWHNFCNSLDSTTPSKKVWNMFRKMEGKQNFDFQYPIVHNGLFMQNSNMIANVFANYYSTVSFNSTLEVTDPRIANLTITAALSITSNAPYNDDFNLEELHNAILSLNHDSATGPDNIHNKFFINLPQSLYIKLLETINASWGQGLIPDEHKQATLIPILKPGKDKHETASYRPIALLSCFSKLIERLVFNRLYAYLENNNLLNKNQCGFRRGHSCLDILAYLEHYIQLALRSQKVLLIIFCDIEKAFDSASHLNILCTLLNKGIRGRMFRWFFDFFHNRSFNVRINNFYSDKTQLHQGVPQGAILSPLLFSLILSDMPSLHDTHSLLYADDLSMFVIEDSLGAAVDKLQTSVTSTSLWLKDKALKLNPSKSNLMMFF